MRLHDGLRFAALIAVLALFSACARRPARELAVARERLADADRAQAAIYASSSFEEARRSLEQSERLLAQRKYDDARVVALESAAHSRSAIAMSAENKRKMLDALNLNLDSTRRDLTDADREIETARAQHVDAKQIDLFTHDAAAARDKLAEAQRLQRAGDLPGGRKASDDARDAADMVLHEIRFAIAQNPITHPLPKKKRRSRAP
jgi:hypothetical protein